MATADVVATPLRVLMVEDSAEDVTVILQALGHSGFEVTHAQVSNLESLHEALALTRWDVMLCDLVQPGMSCTELITHLRELGFNLPVIFVSRAAGPGLATELQNLGACAFVSKNKLGQLGPAIGHCLSAPAAPDEAEKHSRGARSPLRRNYGMLMLLLAVLSVILAGSYYLHEKREHDARIQSAFQIRVEARTHAIQEHLQELDNLLLLFASFFTHTTQELDDELEEFSGMASAIIEHPGLVRLGYGERVATAEWATWEREASKLVEPLPVIPLIPRTVSSPILDHYLVLFDYAKPQTQTWPVGFDLTAASTWHETLLHVATNRVPDVTPCALATGKPSCSWALLFTPVFAPHSSDLRGVIYAELSIATVINYVMYSSPSGDLDIRLEDITDHDHPIPLYYHSHESQLRQSLTDRGTAREPFGFAQAHTIQVSGRTWRLTFLSSAEIIGYDFEREYILLPTAILIGTVLVLGLMGLVWRQTADVERLVTERTTGLHREMSKSRALEASLREANIKLSGLIGELDQRVRARTAELETANKELEAFSYSVSHDLRSPLRAIDGFSQALLEDYADKLDEQAGDYLNRVRAASQRMDQLINDLLKLSRVIRAPLNNITVDLTALAHEISEEIKGREPQRQVVFTITPQLNARGDLQLLHIVLDNLLNNAWKFTSKTTQAHIQFGAYTDKKGQRVFFVRDNGAGFDMAYVDKLFGAFQRLHSPADFPGSGVGLATVARIIRRHGGQVWGEGKPGAGASFYFTL